MTTSPRVRVAGVDDLPALLRLVAQLHSGQGPPDERAGRAALEHILERPDHTLLVAEVDGEPAGTLHLVVAPNLTHDGKPWAIVENVVVDEPHRRRGVGRALMDEAMARARAAGCYKVQLLSAVERDAAAFYESLGFEARALGYRRYF